MRLFTLEEANALIPKLELIMQRLQRCGVELRGQIETVVAQRGSPADAIALEEALARQPQLRGLVEEMQQLVHEIERCEVHFKGIDLGLVDFPADIEGQIGLLCWQYGEKEITHWHTPESGFAGRQPLQRVTRRSYLQ